MAIEEFAGELDQVSQPQAPQLTGAPQPQVVEFTGELDRETTQNPLMGGLARILELGGAGAEALQRGSAGLRKDLEAGTPEILRSKFLSDEAVKERQKQFTGWAQQQAKDIGYEPSTQLKDLGENPLKVIPFVAERVITSSPDMAAAAFAFTPYVMTRTNEILNERLKNDNRTYDQATVGDVATATAAAIGEASLERFATKRILPGGKGIAAAPAAPGAAKRIGKEVGLQAGTESLEELSSYGGETIGTAKGFQPEEAGERMLEAGIVGAGLGGGARGAREVYDRYAKVEELPPDAKIEPEKPLTKGERKDAEQAADRAAAQTQAKPEAPVTKEPTEVKQDKGTIAGVTIQEIPVDQLNLSKDVPQFKAEADEQGIVEPLKSEKYDRIGTPPIQVWKRADGTLEVISGRHRWDLARRTGEKTIPAQVFDEAEGFTGDMAAIMDAELNIRDEKGRITDYVNYFRKAGELGATKQDYESRGLLDGQTGKRAYAVTVQGSDELIHALNAGQIKDDAAYRIATAVPNDPRLQALGLKLVNEKPLEQAINVLYAAKTIPATAPEQGGDLFGFDDSGLKLAEDMGKLALDKQRALSADINTIERAGKNPVIAKKYGIDVKNPEAIKAKVKELKSQRAAWDNWASDPALVDVIRRELAGETVTPVDVKAPRKVVGKGEDSSINLAAQASRQQADAAGLTGDIEAMFADKMQITQIAEALGDRINFVDPNMRNAWVIQVGATLGVPGGIGKKGQAELEKWIADYNKRTGKEAKAAAERAAWDNWASDPELVDQIRRELAGETVVEPTLPEEKPKKEAPIVKYRKEAAEIEASLPKVAKGYTRLYRGNRPGEVGTGRMFTNSLDGIALPFADAYKGPLSYIDVKTEDLDKYVSTGAVADNAEFSIPEDIAATATVIDRKKEKAAEKPAKKKASKKEIKELEAESAKAAATGDLDKSFKIEQKIKELQGTMPSFELEPEQKQTPADKKAAAEREEKEIADREREFFTLTPRTPEQGAGNYLQQDMIGAAGFTYDEYKKFIDKKSTEPGEPLVLRDVTMSEHDSYNDEANAKVDAEIIDELSNMDNVKDVEVEEDTAKTLSKQAQAVEDYVNLASQGKVTAAEFMKSVREAAAKGDIEPDVFNAIEKIYKMAPSVLDGIRFEVATQGNKRRGRYLEIGHYQPLARMIRLFKDTSGVTDPSTVRHEIAHTMEQMMTPEQKRLVIRAWKDELIRATRAEESDAGHIFFQNVAKFLHSPGVGTYKNVIKSMPNESYYQYVNPSEYWAVNAEQILKSREAGSSGLKSMVEKLHEGLKQSFGMSNFWVGNRVFDQILNGDRFSNKMLISYLRQTKMRNYLGEKAPLATWDSMGTSWLENQKYKYVDKYIDLLRAKQDIERMTGDVAEDVDAYVKETLSHSRISTRIKDFMRDYVNQLAETMRDNKISQQQLHEYLWARHAPDYNRVVGERNPEMGDNAAGITTTEAENYIKSLGKERVAQLDKAAAWIDKMTQDTRNILVDSGLETPETIAAWESMYKNYVPLYRKDLEYAGGRMGIGKGFRVQGKFSKAAMGSTKEVTDISESIIRDHIRAIEKAERARVSRALYGMAISHPNPNFWMPIDPNAIKNKAETKERLRNIGVDEELIDNLMQTPKTGVINPETGLVEYRPSRVVLQSSNVLATRIDGKDVYVVFNNSDPRAARLAGAMQNMDLPDVEGFYRWSAYVTRYFAMVNTQLNPIFGLWNFARDVQGAALNLSTTPLKGMEKQILKDSFGNVVDIYRAIRQERATGKRATTKGADDWYDFQESGGTTGYKAQFVKPKQETQALQDAVKDLNRGKPMKAVNFLTNWISDYNDTLENAVRLAAYKTALSQGMSKQKAADIAKNLTVNFNRKGANSQIAGALYAFFNASVQGTSRLYQTLRGPIGKKIMFGGFMLGVVQSAMMSLAGLGEDEPPEFVKEKNIIIPLGLLPGAETKKYIAFPMPLGFNVFPGVGRIFGEAVIGAYEGRDVSKKFFDMLSLVANSFNPLGSSGLAWQTIMPTPLDPMAAIAQNKDAFGRPIYKADRETNPQVGYERTRDSTDAFWKNTAMFINYMTGGTEDIKGVWSPTGDEIAFLSGQLTGGLGREFGKVYGAAKDFVRGDEIPPYKIPLFGKLYGDAESKASVKNRFYANVTKLAEVERTIKGRQKRGESIGEYRREHPEAQLVNMANRIENEISQLNQRRKALIDRGATIAQIKNIEDIKERKMRLLNERYDKLR